MQNGHISTSRYTLAYDSDCGPCTMFRRLVGFLDRSKSIKFIPLTQADNEGLLDSIQKDFRFSSFHLILPGREVRSGSDGVLELIRILPGGRVTHPIVRYLPGAIPLVRFIYARLSRLHNNSSCAINSDNV